MSKTNLVNPLFRPSFEYGKTNKNFENDENFDEDFEADSLDEEERLIGDDIFLADSTEASLGTPAQISYVDETADQIDVRKRSTTRRKQKAQFRELKKLADSGNFTLYPQGPKVEEDKEKDDVEEGGDQEVSEDNQLTGQSSKTLRTAAERWHKATRKVKYINRLHQRVAEPENKTNIDKETNKQRDKSASIVPPSYQAQLPEYDTEAVRRWRLATKQVKHINKIVRASRKYY